MRASMMNEQVQLKLEIASVKQQLAKCENKNKDVHSVISL